MKQKIDGFTLLEIMMALMIIALISVFSVVTYQLPIQKTEYQAAKVSLLFLAREIESYFDSHHTYRGFSVEKITIPVKCHYNFTVRHADEDQYTLAAIPKQTTRDDTCGVFYLDQDGNKTISGKGPLEQCW